MTGDIGLGFLVNLFFWAVVVSAIVFVGAWAAAELFPGTAIKLRDSVRKRIGSGRVPEAGEASARDEVEEYRKAS